MYGHPSAYWADPREERRKRAIAFIVGLVAGAGVIAFYVWLL